jgi:anti-anti-sigma regulatory factor
MNYLQHPPDLLSDPEPGVTIATVTNTSTRCTHVVIVGDIDLYSLDMLESEFAGLPLTTTTALVVDVSRVSFCGVAGVRLLLTLRDRAHDSGVPLDLVVGTGPVRAVLEHLGVTGAFSLQTDHASALAVLGYAALMEHVGSECPRRHLGGSEVPVIETSTI